MAVKPTVGVEVVRHEGEEATEFDINASVISPKKTSDVFSKVTQWVSLVFVLVVLSLQLICSPTRPKRGPHVGSSKIDNKTAISLSPEMAR